MDSLQGIPGFDEKSFEAVHQSGRQVTAVRRNPGKASETQLKDHFDDKWSDPVPWSPQGRYLTPRPSFTFDPLFHAGCYYVQEASSMFLEQALRQSVDLSGPLKVLDLCAAPGGKSTHLQSLLSKDSLLVSNEVIRQRAHVLRDNIVKWGCSNTIVTNNDPKDFSRLEGYFDVIVIDAPCSGSGLFRKDEAAIGQWSESNVILCHQRQQRILADVLPALKEGGVLIYSTCSYSRLEDEAVVDWLTGHFALSNLELELSDAWNIQAVATATGNLGYRFWPHLLEGEGFFLSVFRNHGTGLFQRKQRVVMKPVTKQVAAIVGGYADTNGFDIIQGKEKLYAWPAVLFDEFDLILQRLHIIYSGILIGELAYQKCIPDHALAMSLQIGSQVEKIELSLEQAIAYLQRNPLSIDVSARGWQLAAYHRFPLGWMNILTNRINNYYPKELRILKKQR